MSITHGSVGGSDNPAYPVSKTVYEQAHSGNGIGLFNVQDHGAAGDGVTDDTAEFQATLAAALAAGYADVLIPVAEYPISGTLEVGRFQTVRGSGHGSSRLWPGIGQTVPTIYLSGSPGGEGASIEGVQVAGGGLVDVPAIQMYGDGPTVDHCRLDTVLGNGIDLTGSMHAAIRDTRVVNIIGTGVGGSSNCATIENVQSSGGGIDGFALTGGFGVLTGCSADGNGRHGFYITGGQWTLHGCYAEANTGDAVKVDGSVNIISAMTMTADAAQGASSILVTGQAKDLPAGSILRFPNGAVSVTQTGMWAWEATTTVNLDVPLSLAQTSGTVIPVAIEDVNPLGFPTVYLGPGNYDGTLTFKACHYGFIGGWMPVLGSISAHKTARLIGEPHVTTARHRPRKYGPAGGSAALAAGLGLLVDAIPATGLLHLADPLAVNPITGSNNGFAADATALAGFHLPLLTVNHWAAAADGWELRSLPKGSYLIRAHVKNASQEASAIQVRVAPFDGGEVNQTFTAQSTGWEWVEMEYEHGATFADSTNTIVVQRKGSTEVDVDCIRIVPLAPLVSTRGVVKAGRGITSGRPSPVSVGAGAQWFDTTLSKPIWSDGTVWRDAAGTAV